MIIVKKVDENNKEHVVDCLRLDVVKHAFAFNDIQYEPERTTMYATFENGSLKGYILIYTAMDFQSVVLECEENLAAKLIDYAPENHFIIHTSPDMLTIIRSRFPRAKHYLENWMLVKKGEASFFKSELARRLCTEDDAARLAHLLSTREDRPSGTVKKYMDLISKMPVYGVFMNDELVSYAGSFIQLPQVWMIGGVYTHPNHRNKGYSTLATSAVTQEALKSSETAALFVRSDNYAAIRVYEKIGYRKIGDKLWVDVGTGQKP
jgi:ribosomal protein S18 acetylase RimI-like enzyme